MKKWKVSKKDWPDGPWMHEPDYEEFDCLGLKCAIKRNTLGALCGYVFVPMSHPAYGLHYDAPQLRNISVHGGLTWAASAWQARHGWGLGFDTCHLGDMIPGMPDLGIPRPSDDRYRDISWVRAETVNLAKQLLAMR